MFRIEQWRERNRRQRERWKSIPDSSVLLVMAFGFCLFASIGALTQLSAVHVAPLSTMWIFPSVTGVFASAMVWVSVRGNGRWVIAVVLAFLGTVWLMGHYIARHSNAAPTMSEVQRWLTLTSMMTVALIASGWGLALHFINREGERLFRAETEMRLAGEIHQALVPIVDRRIGNYEFYGVSLPSGMVGGDLVDVFACGNCWVAYVADVSGHGVSSGVLMAMIKSSVHTALQHQPHPGPLLKEVNRVLCSLQLKHMFATCGLVAFSPEGGLQYSLAGHLPIPRLHADEIEMLGESNLPLGIFPEAEFQAFSFGMQRGDILAIATDGLTEVVAEDSEEIGFRGISKALLQSKERPLKDVAADVLSAVSFAARSDDQTLLLVRCL